MTAGCALSVIKYALVLQLQSLKQIVRGDIMTVSIEEFKNFELKIAFIESAEPHPNADRLYILKLKVGEVKKQIVAGIRAFYGEEELKGKKIVIVNNLETAVIRGVESQGMLLAASVGKDELSLLVPERPITDGAIVR